MQASRSLTKRLRSVLGLGLLLACGAAPALAQPRFPADTVGVSIAEGLEYVLHRDVPHALAPHLILRAGRSGEPSFAPTLKRIVESYDPEESTTSIMSSALLSLYWLGEEGYLLEQARRWRENVPRATYAINILAFDPSDLLVEELAEVGREATDGYIAGAYGKLRNMNRRNEVFNASTTPLEERIEMAIQGVGHGWTIYWGAGEYSTDPRVAVGRKWLRQVADEAPEAVAQAIADLRIEDFPEKEAEARAYLARYTNEQVRALLGITLERE